MSEDAGTGRLGVDVGGTFTDLVLLSSGRLVTCAPPAMAPMVAGSAA